MRVVFWIAFILAYIPGRLIFPTKILGKENLPDNKKGLLLVANHLTWKDILIIIFSIPGFRFILSKKENGKNPVARFFLKLFGVVFIDRDNIEVSAMRNLVKILKEGNSMIMFPEGTRNRVDASLQPIKSGAALIALQSGATVMPTMLADRPRVFHRTYFYIAPVFKLCDIVARPYNSERIAEATTILETKMREGLEYVQNRAALKKERKRR